MTVEIYSHTLLYIPDWSLFMPKILYIPDGKYLKFAPSDSYLIIQENISLTQIEITLLNLENDPGTDYLTWKEANNLPTEQKILRSELEIIYD